jgi:hypothetical protein
MISDVQIYDVQVHEEPWMPGMYMVSMKVKARFTLPASSAIVNAEAEVYEVGGGIVASASMNPDAALGADWWSASLSGFAGTLEPDDVIFAKVDANWSYMVSGEEDVNSAPTEVPDPGGAPAPSPPDRKGSSRKRRRRREQEEDWYMW